MKKLSVIILSLMLVILTCPAALADQTLTCSAGVTITVAKTGDATYTITGVHDNGTKKYVYDSTSHGVTEEDK